MRWNMSLIAVCMLIVPALPQTGSNSEQITRLAGMTLEDLLNTKVTTAGKKEEKIGEIPASVVVVRRKDIERYGYCSLEEILADIPGLYMLDTYYWVGTVNYGVRGFYATSSLSDLIIMVNGVVQQEDWFNSAPLSKVAVPVEAIDRIEVIRGPMSVIYGSGAFFGAINIITNDPEAMPEHYLVSMTGGAGGEYRLSGRAGLTRKDLELVANVSGYGGRGPDEPYSGMISDPAALNLPVDKTTRNQLRDHRIYFDVSGHYRSFIFAFNGVKTTKGIVDSLPSPAGGHIIDVSALNFSGGLRHRFNPCWQLQSKLEYYYYDNYFDYEFSENGPEDGQITTRALGLYTDAFYSPDPRLDLTFGFSLRSAGKVFNSYHLPNFGFPDYELTMPGQSRLNTVAGYAQATLAPRPWLKMVGGVRVERVQPYSYVLSGGPPASRFLKERHFSGHTVVIPRFGAILTPRPAHVLKILYGQATKQPPPGNATDVIVPEAPELVPSTIKTFEINYLFSPSTKINLNGSIFQNWLDRLIVRQNDNTGIFSSNQGKMTTTGAELTLRYTPDERWRLEASASIQDSKNHRPGYEHAAMAFAPRFLGYLKAACRYPRWLTIAATARYVSSMESEWDPLVQRRIGEKAGAYLWTTLHLRFEDAGWKGFYFALHVDNLLGRDFQYPVTLSNSWSDLGTPGAQRSTHFTAGCKF